MYVNFKENESAKKIFDADLNVNRIIIDLSALIPDSHFVEGKTVIIFDEIQECANARSSIKPFCEDGRFDIIATESLLGIKGYNKKKSKGVPTGFERIVYMKPMDFEEFLWAKGIGEEVIQYLRECYEKKGRSENYLPAIQWLCDFGIINLCHNLNNISDPLEGNKIDNIFKVYMQDSGLEIIFRPLVQKKSQKIGVRLLITEKLWLYYNTHKLNLRVEFIRSYSFYEKINFRFGCTGLSGNVGWMC